jgi:hypothetical protein
MPLIYAFVARRQTVLAEFTNYSGNFSTIATQVRASERASDARRVRGLERARARVALRFGLETNRDATRSMQTRWMLRNTARVRASWNRIDALGE